MFAKTLTRIFQDESGVTAIEYSLIVALISVAAIGVLTSLGTSLGNVFNLVSTTLMSAAGG